MSSTNGCFIHYLKLVDNKEHIPVAIKYEGWNFNSGNYLFTTDTK